MQNESSRAHSAVKITTLMSALGVSKPYAVIVRAELLSPWSSGVIRWPFLGVFFRSHRRSTSAAFFGLKRREGAIDDAPRSAMRYSLLGSLLLLVVSPTGAPTARTPGTRPEQSLPGTLPRATDGRPDLQGIWTNDTYTPLERPRGFEDKAFFSEREKAAFQKQVRDDLLALVAEANQKTTGDIGYGEFGTLISDRRTSLIIDPVNGRIPPLLPEVRRRLEGSGLQKADGPEDLDAAARCLSWPGPPMLPPPSNTQLQIVQTHDYVVIFRELFGEARIVPLDSRPHLPPDMCQWKGDARGRWEGDTLVVDTVNFRSKGPYQDIDHLKDVDEYLHVIERFTLTDADTISYRFSVEDPTVYEREWTAELPFARASKPIFEYACHEGNYSLENTLRGARDEERRKAASPK